MQSLRMSTKPPQRGIVLICRLCMDLKLCLICLDYDGVYDRTRVHICVCVHTRLLHGLTVEERTREHIEYCAEYSTVYRHLS